MLLLFISYIFFYFVVLQSIAIPIVSLTPHSKSVHLSFFLQLRLVGSWSHGRKGDPQNGLGLGAITIYHLVFQITVCLFQSHLGLCELKLTDLQVLPWQLNGKESTCQCRRHDFDPWSKKITHAVWEQLSPCTTILSLCSRVQEPQLLKPLCPRAHAPQQHETLQ